MYRRSINFLKSRPLQGFAVSVSLLACCAFSSALTFPVSALADPVSEINSPSSANSPSPDVSPKVDAVLQDRPVSKSLKVSSDALPFTVSGKVSRTIQTVTGLNLFASLIANQAAKSVLKKKMGGDVKVKIKLYSFTDLLSGKIKSVDCKLDGSNVQGVKIGSVTASTNQPIWLDLHDKRHVRLKTPVLVAVNASLSEKDIAEALKSPKVANSLRGLNLDLPGLGAQQLQVVNPKVTLSGDVVRIETLLKTQGADDSTGVPLIITGKLKLKGDDRIEIDELKIEGSDIIEPTQFATFIEDLLNPLIDLKRMDRKDHAFRLTKFDVGGGGVSSQGRLLIAPKTPNVYAPAVQTR